MRAGGRKSNQGVFLVLFAVGVLVILSLIGFLFGVSFLTTNQGILQNSTNLASISALNAYYESGDFTNAQRAAKALAAANLVIKGNSLYFSGGQMGDLVLYTSGMTPSSTTAGYLQLGSWTTQKPSDGSDPCAGSYPCLVPFNGVPPDGTRPDAAKIYSKTGGTSSITVPFSKFLSTNNQSSVVDVNASGIALVNSRCTAFLIDLSLSSTADSHNFASSSLLQEWKSTTSPDYPGKYSGYTPARLELVRPDNPGLFAYNLPTGGFQCSDFGTNQPSYDTQGTEDPWDDTWDFSKAQWSAEQLYYCGLSPSRTADNNPTSGKHYRDDYREFQTPYGPQLIDIYTPPEPLTSYLVAINAGLRTMESQRVTTDQVFLMGFGAKQYVRIPEKGLTSNLSFLIDITDYRRGGTRYWDPTTRTYKTQQPMSPNFIDWGIFPNIDRNNTDIIGALYSAIISLSDPTQCPSNARKAIILATDGISNINYNPWGQIAASLPTFGTYGGYEDQLLSEDDPSGILQMLRKQNVMLTVILSGDSVEPNFLNYLADPNDANSFLTPLSGPAKGARGGLALYAATGEIPFFQSDPKLPDNLDKLKHLWDPRVNAVGANGQKLPDVDYKPCEKAYYIQYYGFKDDERLDFRQPYLHECAFPMAGHHGAKFRRPNGTLGQLAIMSKGLMCPLMDPYRTSSNEIDMNCYDSNLDWKDGGGQCTRVNGTFQKKAIRGLEKAGQAAECTLVTIGNPPFTLVTDEKTTF